MNRISKCALLLAIAALLFAAPAQAVDYLWNVAGPADMNVGTNWNPNLPGAGDLTGVANGDWLYVNNAGIAELYNDIGIYNADPTLITGAPDYFYVGRGAGTSGTVNQYLGTVTLGGGLRGIGRDGGTGTYSMFNGTIKMNSRNLNSDSLLVGQGVGSTGNLTVVDGAVITMTPYVDPTLWGGARQYYWQGFIGNAGGTGVLAMDNWGFIEAGSMFVGNSDPWVVGSAPSSGTVTLTNNATLNLHNSPDWTVQRFDTITLSIGRGGSTGTMTVTDSTLMVAGMALIGDGTNAGTDPSVPAGNVGLPGGTASTGSLTLQGSTAMTMTPGTFRNYGWVWNVGGDVTVGGSEWFDSGNDGGDGTLTIKDSATLTAASGSVIVANHRGRGTFDLTGGTSTVTAVNVYFGLWNGIATGTMGTGTDTPTINATGEFRVGDSGYGNFTMNSGTITDSGHFRVGYNGYGNADNYGVYTQNAGTVTVGGWVQIGNNDGGTDGYNRGTVNMNGGTFTEATAAGNFFLLGRGMDGTWNQNAGNTDIQTIVCIGNRGHKGTLNLNGGVFTAGYIQFGYENDTNAVGEINFNGGVLKVNTVGPYVHPGTGGEWIVRYMSQYATLNVNVGGAKIDTSGKDISIGGLAYAGDLPLLHDPDLGATPDGGLTVFGGGKVYLSGVNTYNGPTDVQAGGLFVRKGGSLATTGIKLASGLTLDVSRNATPSVVTGVLNSLNLGAGTTVNVSVPATNAVPLFNATGTGGVLTLPTGADVVNVPIIPADATIASGVWYDLFKANSIAAGTDANVNLTTTLNATITKQVAANSVQFKIDNLVTKDVTWTGSVTGDWTIGGDTNWVDTGGATPQAYYDLYTVRFTDAVTPTTTTAALNTEVHLGGTIVASGANSYTVAGTGSIAGPIGLTKTGSGTFTLNTANAFTGNVSITEGGVITGAKSALGVGNNVVVSGAGTTLVANAALLGQNSSTNLDVTGGAAVTVNGEVVVGYQGVNGTVNVTNSTMAVTAGTRIGYRGSNGAMNLTNSTYTYGAHITVGDGERFASSPGVINMDAASIVGSSPGPIYVGLRRDGPGTINMINGSQINTSGIEICIGYNDNYNGEPAPHSGASGTINMSDTSKIINTTGGLSGYGESGTLNMSASSSVASAFIQVGSQNMNSSLTFNLKDNATVTTSDYARVGFYGGVPGTFTRVKIDGTAANVGVNNFNVATNFYVGWQWGGVVSELADNSVTVVGDNAKVTVGGEIVLGSRAGQGAWNQDAGLTTSAGTVRLGQYDFDVWPDGSAPGGSVAALNLNGGTFVAPAFSTDASPDTAYGGNARGTANFNGGKLVVTTSTADLFAQTGVDVGVTLNVMKNATTNLGAVIDTQANNVTINQGLLHGTGVNPDGGLTKEGTGRLTLAGNPTYDGPTDIKAGLLQIAHTAGPVNLPGSIISSTGAGGLLVPDGVTLTTPSISVDSLTIGGAILSPPPGAAEAIAAGQLDLSVNNKVSGSIPDGAVPASNLAPLPIDNTGLNVAPAAPIGGMNGVSPVPEPGTLVLLALAGLALAGAYLRRK